MIFKTYKLKLLAGIFLFLCASGSWASYTATTCSTPTASELEVTASVKRLQAESRFLVELDTATDPECLCVFGGVHQFKIGDWNTLGETTYWHMASLMLQAYMSEAPVSIRYEPAQTCTGMDHVVIPLSVSLTQ